MARLYNSLQAHRRRSLVRHSPGSDVPDDLMAKAIATLGSKAAASEWFAAPAIGLGQRKPGMLLGTSQGRAEVAAQLDRMAYGVYV